MLEEEVLPKIFCPGRWIEIFCFLTHWLESHRVILANDIALKSGTRIIVFIFLSIKKPREEIVDLIHLWVSLQCILHYISTTRPSRPSSVPDVSPLDHLFIWPAIDVISIGLARLLDPHVPQHKYMVQWTFTSAS